MNQSISLEKQFLKYVIPSVFTMFLSGLYTIIDGFFVGRAVGDTGLAAIGLVWPVTAVLIALGMGVGAGGSVLMTSWRGAGEKDRSGRARGNTILLLLAASVAVTAVLLLFNPYFVKALGASGSVYDAAMDYIHIIALGGSMQIIASGLIPIIRNSSQTVTAMMIMGSGLISNIGLDALFTIAIPWGLRGAAIATIISQSLTVLLSVLCLIRQKEHPIRRTDFRPDPRIMLRAAVIGVSPFGLSLMPSLITVFNNWQCLAYGGDSAVAAYAVINYFIASVLLMLEGIGEGMQPLISYCSGAKDYETMRRIRNRGIRTAALFSGIFLLLTIPAATALPGLFSVSGETASIVSSALPVLCAAFPMMGLGKLFTSYFYACGEPLFSTLLVYSDPLLFTPLCLMLLPRAFGLSGVWMALPGAQALIMILLTILLAAHKIKIRRQSAADKLPEGGNSNERSVIIPEAE